MRILVIAVCAAAMLAVPASAAGVDPKALVLQQSDVPSAFRLDRGDSGIVTNAADSQGRAEGKAFIARSGRIVGYVALYVRQDPDAGIESRADLFRQAGGARMMLDRFNAYWRALGPGLPRSPAGIGTESWVYAGSIDSIVGWRYGRVFGSVVGIDMSKRQTLALARVQQRRIVGALR